MRTLLLFDIDGTLLDAAGAGRTAFLQALGERFPGHRFPQVSMAGRTDRGLWEELARGLDPQPGDFEGFLRRYVELLEEALRQAPPQEVPGAGALLRALAAHPDLVPCLVTGNVREGARGKLQALGWWQVFEGPDGVLGTWGHEASTKRPLARELLETWARREPGHVRALFLGDTLADLEAARHAGIPCLVVNGNRPAAEFLAAGALEVWQDWAAEPAAAVVGKLRALAG